MFTTKINWRNVYQVAIKLYNKRSYKDGAL